MLQVQTNQTNQPHTTEPVSYLQDSAFSPAQGERPLEHPVTPSIPFKTCSPHYKNLISRMHCPVTFWLLWTEITLIATVRNPCSLLSRCLILSMEKAPIQHNRSRTVLYVLCTVFSFTKIRNAFLNRKLPQTFFSYYGIRNPLTMVVLQLPQNSPIADKEK